MPGWKELEEQRRQRKKKKEQDIAGGRISEHVRQQASQGDLEDAIALILGEQARRSEQLYTEQAPLRRGAQSVLLQQLQNPLPLPDLSGLADVTNPFRRQFSFDLGAPAPVAAAPLNTGVADLYTQPGAGDMKKKKPKRRPLVDRAAAAMKGE